MPRACTDAVELEYELSGPADGRPLLLIHGLGMQMAHWEDAFVAALVDRGHRVVRFDNRDIGLSSWLDHLGPADIASAMTGVAPYTLSHMATDTAELLDAIGWRSAHVVGASMGGMIAQTLAIAHPARVRSLVSIMSSSGAPGLPPPTPEAMAVLMTPPPADRDGAIAAAVRAFQVIGSPGFPTDETTLRAMATRAFDRAFHPAGVGRQFAAVLASGSRRDLLSDVRAPALVIHGREDPLVPLGCGEDTAAAIPGAELLVVDGMGHDLPAAVWPRLIDAITSHTARADG